jgi:hypothetical protein
MKVNLDLIKQLFKNLIKKETDIKKRGKEAKMILLGQCPRCGSKDTLSVSFEFPFEYRSKVRCENCSFSWRDWVELFEKEIGKGNKIIPVDIMKNDGIVELMWPLLSEIPFASLIREVLSLAVAERFGLTFHYLQGGEILGKIKGEEIALANMPYKIGLYDENRELRLCHREADMVLEWYERLLKNLFQEKLYNFGRGAILKLRDLPGTQEESKARAYLWLAIRRTTRRLNFPRKVFKKFQALQEQKTRIHSGIFSKNINSRTTGY